ACPKSNRRSRLDPITPLNIEYRSRGRVAYTQNSYQYRPAARDWELHPPHARPRVPPRPPLPRAARRSLGYGTMPEPDRASEAPRARPRVRTGEEFRTGPERGRAATQARDFPRQRIAKNADSADAFASGRREEGGEIERAP